MPEWDKRGKLRVHPSGRHAFWCPACKSVHQVVVGVGGWSFNGNPERPTFGPSVLVRGYEPMTDAEHVDVMRSKPVERRPLVCHSFVENGQIRYLDDCTHAMAGQTVDLPADGWDYEP